jgi:hypothetical protein
MRLWVRTGEILVFLMCMCVFTDLVVFVFFIPLDFQGLSGTHWTPPSKEEALFQSSGFVFVYFPSFLRKTFDVCVCVCVCVFRASQHRPPEDDRHRELKKKVFYVFPSPGNLFPGPSIGMTTVTPNRIAATEIPIQARCRAVPITLLQSRQPGSRPERA